MDKLKRIQEKNKLILKSPRRFGSDKHNVFFKEVNKIALSANDVKRIQSIDSIETYAYVTSKEIMHIVSIEYLLSFHILCKMFINILNNTNQAENVIH